MSEPSITPMPHQPSWLKAAADQRLALMNEMLQLQQLTGYAIVMSQLTEPDEGATPEDFERHERTCDNCGKFCKDEFFTGILVRDVGVLQVMISFGTCAECKDLP